MPLKLSYKSTVLFNLADEMSSKYQDEYLFTLYLILNS